MVTVLIVGKNGEITETSLKTFSIEEICKKAKVKSTEDYKPKHVWTVTIKSVKYHIAVYAKVKGRAGQENKYDFPPPIDSELYYGNCMLVSRKNATEANEVIDLSKAIWETIYEELFGGFDDCMESEDESEDDLDGVQLSKSGYALDDFVVEDEDLEVVDVEEEVDMEEEEEDNDYETEEEEIEIPKKTKSVKKTTKKQKEPKLDEYLGCDSELEEEEYFE